MEDIEIIKLWKSYDQRLQESLVLNRQHTEEITRLKAQSFLSSMRPIKVFTVLAGILWVALVDMVLVNNFRTLSSFFLVSMGIQVLLTKLAIGIYLYQLILLHQTDVSEPILATQERIARLQSSTIWVTRLLFLQLPVWTTFFLTWNTLVYAPIGLLILQVAITALFTWAAIWLFINIRYENRHKRWFRLLFRGREWDPMLKAMEVLGQISEYKGEKKA